MKHLIFGTGLIGSFLGGGLHNAGFDVSFLARKRQIEAMKSGFTVSALDGPKVALPPPVFTAVADCMKELENYIKDGSIIVCCQNGFGSEAIVKSSFPNITVLTATVGFNVANQGDQHFHRSTQGSLVVESHDKVKSVVELLDKNLLPSHLSSDIHAERWEKLQLNLANPVNALADIPTKAMTEERDYRLVSAALMSELLKVVNRMGISLPKLTALPASYLPGLMKLPNFLYLRLAQRTLAIDPTARVSMWWDLSQNIKTEIDFLNGSVVNQAKELGIECPVNERIIELIKEVETGKRQMGISGKELQSLLGVEI